MRLKDKLLNNQQFTEEIKKEIKIYLKINDNENMKAQDLWDATKTVLRELYSIKSLPQETRKTLNKQPNLTSNETRKRRTKKPQN